MKKIKVTSAATSKNWSSYWLGSEFDTDFGRGNDIDYTKLAGAQRAIGNFVNIVTGKQIPVVFHSNDSSYTDGERVVIGTKLEDKNFDSAVGLALHEGSHIAYTDFNLLKSPNNYLSNTKLASIVKSNGVDAQTEEEFRIIKDLLNWIEDRRIDYKIYTNAPGYRMYYEAMYNKYFNDKIIDKALISGEMNKETWEGYMFHVINFTNPMRQLNALTQLRNIWDTIDLRNIERLQTTEDALKIAGDVFSIIKTAIAENADSAEAQKPAPSDNMQPGSGNEEDGMSNGNKDADDDSDNTAPGSNLSPRDLEKLEKAIDAQRKFLRDEVQKKGKLTKSGAAIVNAMRESGTEVRDVYTNTAGDAGKVSTIVIKKLTPGIICSIPDLFENASADMINGRVKLDAGTWNTKSIVKNQEAVMRGIVLGRQLGNKLQLRNADRTLKTTRLQTGKIDRRLVAQLGYDNVNVFHRIVTDKYKNYFIHISIDASGSMSGCKWWQSITSAVAIAQAASMTTGIRVQISLRGTENIGGGSEKCVTIYVYDSAHDKINKITNYFKYLTTFGCTPEGLAFKSIEKDIKSDARGDELIFINYSDGAPSPVHGAHCTYNGINFTRKIINDFRSTGINIISYFINAGSVWESDRREFTTMYGSDSKFINPESMLEISKSINAKFLEMAE
jgi:hypothetical protein